MEGRVKPLSDPRQDIEFLSLSVQLLRSEWVNLQIPEKERLNQDTCNIFNDTEANMEKNNKYR